LPFKIGSADAAVWYSGYLAGRAKRANTARASRAALVNLRDGCASAAFSGK
jgi:hypothetical protein